MKRLTGTCAWCGEPFDRVQRGGQIPHRPYCSQSHRAKLSTGSPRPMWRYMNRKWVDVSHDIGSQVVEDI